jgi:hypothetical protein
MIGSFTDNTIILLFIFSVPGTLLCLLVGWTRWKEGTERPDQPWWRGSAAPVGLTLASVSAIAFGGIVACAQFAWAGWSLGSPRWAIISGLGGACALLVVSLAIAGTGKCRIPTLIASLLQLFWWYSIYAAMYAR